MVELVDLSKYMSTEKIAAMGPLERLTCSNKIQNYEVMKGLGKPNYVIYFFDKCCLVDTFILQTKVDCYY
jgi:hypothetical protein